MGYIEINKPQRWIMANQLSRADIADMAVGETRIFRIQEYKKILSARSTVLQVGRIKNWKFKTWHEPDEMTLSITRIS